MKKLLALLLVLVLLAACWGCKKTDAPDTIQIEPKISRLTVKRQMKLMEAVDDYEPFDTYWMPGRNTISADLTEQPGLVYTFTVSHLTQFEGALPAGYDQEKLIEWGKYPGLNVDILHEHGFTGKGAVIAYADLPIKPHEQYDSECLHYQLLTDSGNSMHGPAVLSLLMGKDIGTAPEAEVYFYGIGSEEGDQMRHAECLYQIIEQNKTLPEGKKIRMVGFSDFIDEKEANPAAFRNAVLACENAGIMVWLCDEYGALSFLPYSDRNSFGSLVACSWWGNDNPPLVCVPAGGRTTAATLANAEYIYWSEAGLSWTVPYMLGLYAIAIEIDPTLTQDELRSLIVDTAYQNDSGLRIVHPVGFIAAVLQRVGRDEEAQSMLDEVKARTKRFYAVMNLSKMDQEDLTTVGDSLAAITDATVLVVDAAQFTDADSLYAAIQQDTAERGGALAGVQVFGTDNEMDGLYEDIQNLLAQNNCGTIEPNAVCLALCDVRGYIDAGS